MTQIVMPMHTNGVAGVMFGGIMMQWIDEGGRPRMLPPLTLDTDDDVRRHTQAADRRHDRLRAAGRPELAS